MMVVHEENSGRVRWISRGHGDPGILDNGLAVIRVEDRGENSHEVYVHGRQLVVRPKMVLDWHYEAREGEVVVNRIPPGAAVQTPNWEGFVNDGIIIWPVAEPGVYPITIECFPYHSEMIRAEVAQVEVAG